MDPPILLRLTSNTSRLGASTAASTAIMHNECGVSADQVLSHSGSGSVVVTVMMMTQHAEHQLATKGFVCTPVGMLPVMLLTDTSSRESAARLLKSDGREPAQEASAHQQAAPTRGPQQFEGEQQNYGAGG